MSTELTTSLGTWELVGPWLRPTRERLESYVSSLMSHPAADPLVSFALGDGSSSASQVAPAIHLSRLTAADGPLRALATAPFAEAATRKVSLQESRMSFDIIRKFLYCERIDMRRVPPQFAVVADRWGLSVLFEACFRWAERAAFEPCASEGPSIKAFFITYLPIIALLDVPEWFKQHFALRFALGFDAFEDDDIYRLLFPWVFDEPALRDCCRKKRRLAASLGTTTDSASALGDTVSQRQGKAVESAKDRSTCNCLRRKDMPAMDITANECDGTACKSAIEEAAGTAVQSAGPGLEGYDVWEVFRSNGMLAQVIHYIVRYTRRFFCQDLIDVVLRALEPRLSDKEIIDLLQEFDWQDGSCSQALTSSFANEWSLRAWRILAIVNVEARQGTGDEVMAVFRFPDAGRWFKSDAAIEEAWEYVDDSKGYKMGMTITRGAVGNGRVEPVILGLTLRPPEANRFEALHLWRVSTQIDFVQNGCSCGLESVPCKQFQGVGTKRHEHSCEPFAVFTERGGARFRILSEAALEHWKEKHTVKCGMVLRVSLLVRRDNGGVIVSG